MTDFRTEIRDRAARVQGSLATAVADGEDYLVQVLLGDLQSLARIAADHSIDLDGVEESLTRHGLPTPATGIPRVVDLTSEPA